MRIQQYKFKILSNKPNIFQYLNKKNIVYDKIFIHLKIKA